MSESVPRAVITSLADRLISQNILCLCCRL